MDIVQIQTLPQFLDKLLDEPDDLGTNLSWFYRGQKSANWKLIPSLYRSHKTCRLPSVKNQIQLEQTLLFSFKSRVLPYISLVPKNDLEWMMLGQHFGLPTRLLDFTTSPLIAMFFAVEHPFEQSPNDQGVVWAVQAPTSAFKDEALSSNVFETLEKLKEPVGILPMHISSRITGQKSAFIMTNTSKEFIPLEERENLRITKYVIQGEEYRVSIKEELFRSGIDYQTIYPDIHGVIRQIDWLINYHNPDENL